MQSLLLIFTFIIVAFTALAQDTEFTVIAHRGASGYLPEHTLAAATLAHAQNADYIEQDVVLSKDGVPLVVHDIHLENTTNVAELFPTRAREDGRYYAIDFTLSEINTLTVNERKSKNAQVFKGRYKGSARFRIATLADQIELIEQLNRSTNKNTGLYIEVKSPAFHQQHGLDISKVVLNYLRQQGLDKADANVFIQCFDFDELKRLRTELKANVKLVQLIAENSWQESSTNYDQLKTIQGMSDVAKYADGIGPWLGHVTNKNSDELAKWVVQAKTLGLLVHPYTFRTDSLPTGKSAEGVLDLIVNQWQFDGIFTDQVPPVNSFIKHTKKGVSLNPN